VAQHAVLSARAWRLDQIDQFAVHRRVLFLRPFAQRDQVASGA
jgi:uncharacterized protein YijF (DUF1287 family)